MSQIECNDLLSTCENVTNHSLLTELSAFGPPYGMPVVGHTCFRKVESADGQCAMQQMPLPSNLPEWIVPMMAPFESRYTSEWILWFGRAVDYLKKMEVTEGKKKIILVPIKSPGGAVCCLENMLAVMNTCDPSITIVAYAVGEVASCAYVLFASAKVSIMSPSAKLMCHLPAAYVEDARCRKLTTTLDQGEWKEIHSLAMCAERIYYAVEKHVLFRVLQKDEKDNINFDGHYKGKKYKDLKDDLDHNKRSVFDKSDPAREYLRNRWYDRHLHYLRALYRTLRINKEDATELPAFDAKNTDLLTYVTRDIAADETGFFIRCTWAHLLGLTDYGGVDIVTQRHEDAFLRSDTYFDQSLFQAEQHDYLEKRPDQCNTTLPVSSIPVSKKEEME